MHGPFPLGVTMDVAAWLHSQSMRYEHASMEDKKRINSLDQQRAETWFEEHRVYCLRMGWRPLRGSKQMSSTDTILGPVHDDKATDDKVADQEMTSSSQSSTSQSAISSAEIQVDWF